MDNEYKQSLSSGARTKRPNL